MNTKIKNVCCLYRTVAITARDHADMKVQRNECHEFVKAHGWNLLREFWQSQADNDDVALFTDDAILELRAGAEQKQFDILLVHRFKHIGRTAFESPFAACFFDKTGIEVWAVQEGRWDSEEFETILSTWSNEMFN